MSLNGYNLTLEEKQEAGKKFLDYVNAYKYRDALDYFEQLDIQAKKYIRTEGNCNWGLIIARDAVGFQRM